MFDEQMLPGALLVTADGSIDCQENPNEQEAATASLHYAELIAALGLLAVGGTAFLKAFTIFEHSTFSLLYICGAYFDRVCPPAQHPLKSTLARVLEKALSIAVSLRRNFHPHCKEMTE
jgi:hypothetical protein